MFKISPTAAVECTWNKYHNEKCDCGLNGTEAVHDHLRARQGREPFCENAVIFQRLTQVVTTATAKQRL